MKKELFLAVEKSSVKYHIAKKNLDKQIAAKANIEELSKLGQLANEAWLQLKKANAEISKNYNLTLIYNKEYNHGREEKRN